MILSIKKKKEITNELRKNFSIAKSTVVASLHSVTANAMNQLRKDARDSDVYIRVASNSLLRRAVADTSYECLLEFFVEESIVAFSTQNPSDAAQVFVSFAKNYENFKIKGAAFEGKRISSDQISLLSNLPNYKTSILHFISILRVISIGNLIKVLQELSNRAV